MWTLQYTEKLGWPGFSEAKESVPFEKIDRADEAGAIREALAHLKSKPEEVLVGISLSWLVASTENRRPFEKKLNDFLLRK